MHRVVDDLLAQMVELNASDLFLSTNNYPAMRMDGKIKFISESLVQRDLTHQIYEEMTGMTPEEAMQSRTEMDLAYKCEGIGRFRINIFHQNGELGYVFRHIPVKIPSMDELHLPVAVLQKLACLQRGMVLVTGITGSGKSTTLASMVEHINLNLPRHVVTIEDPKEFIYVRKKSLINQREIGRDTPDFPTALRSVVRQSPDVILIGEMRDRETVEAALMAAETGHLVLSSLHTLNAIQTVERILAFFPPHQHNLIRLQMALILEGVVSQRLIRRADQEDGRVPCIEIMLGTPTVKELLEAGQTRALDKALREGGHYGCQTFNQSLADLVRQKLITLEDALSYSDNPDELKMEMRGITQSKSMKVAPKTAQRSPRSDSLGGNTARKEAISGKIGSITANVRKPSQNHKSKGRSGKSDILFGE